MKSALKIATALGILALAACQTMPYQPYAREVKKKPGTGGLIALKAEHRDEDRAKAQSMMATNCSGPVKILEEGEVVVGTNTTSNAKQSYDHGTQGVKVGSMFGVPLVSGANDPSQNTATNSTTTSLKEWNIAYECEKKAVAAEAGGTVNPIKTKKQ